MGRDLSKSRPILFGFDFRSDCRGSFKLSYGWTMNLSVLHPTTRLLCWLTATLLGQGLSGAALAYALPCTVFVIAIVAGTRAVREGWRLVRRVRWLIVALVLVFAWGVPGEPIGGDSRVVPTWEGVQLAALHLGRLLLTLMLIGALLASLSRDDLLSALLTLVLPLRRMGVDCERAVVRMALVLRFVEDAKAADWRQLLRESPPPAESGGLASLLVEQRPLRCADRWLLGGCGVVMGGAVFMFMGGV